METVQAAEATSSTTPKHGPDTSSIKNLSESYDFIVIGGGTSGLVIASPPGVSTAETLLRDPTLIQQLLERYQRDRSGPPRNFTSDSAMILLPEMLDAQNNPPNNNSSLSFLESLLEKKFDKETKSDILYEQVTLNLLAKSDSKTAHYFLAKTQFNISSVPSIKTWTQPSTLGNFFSLFASLNHPFSLSNVKITSPDVRDPPAIDPRYLSHPLDLEILARHVLFMSTILRTPPFSSFFKEGGKRIPSHAFKKGMESPGIEEAREIVSDTLISNYHPAGTSAMGGKDEGGVIDERLRALIKI
ncbi:hypothetical protein G7Y89_g8091 [Cudoniella acicularis]|uniref:Glucose-methanol-choline oxidoreductase C-terminal domain-containing protein n=1 Tax=Cudoniella acicularis TaxID=354080 RepID=A0A8H4RH70_9HELO|nr:hypothetical protein G7Y89_g8091 [Cudoniella acicularis]